MRMIEHVRMFLLTYDQLQSYGAYMVPNVNVDYLGTETVQYTVEPIPTNPILREFVDGSIQKQFSFVFASIQPYGGDVLQNIENTGFYEDLENWFRKMSNDEELPEGWERIECLTSCYVFEVPESTDRARYQMQCRVVYRVQE